MYEGNTQIVDHLAAGFAELSAKVRETGLTADRVGEISRYAQICVDVDYGAMQCGMPFAFNALWLARETLSPQLVELGDLALSRGSLELAAQAYKAAGSNGFSKLWALYDYCEAELGTKLRV